FKVPGKRHRNSKYAAVDALWLLRDDAVLANASEVAVRTMASVQSYEVFHWEELTFAAVEKYRVELVCTEGFNHLQVYATVRGCNSSLPDLLIGP
ncbi:MAG: hypothetical protein ACFCUN_11205, partial [Hyphomicrobiaceae bacterium]